MSSFQVFFLTLQTLSLIILNAACPSEQIQFDASQQLFTDNEPIDLQSEGYQAEYTFIKNQIVKKFFEQYDANKLKVILNMFGCKNADCPRLIDICSIDYVASAPFQKRLNKIGEKENKKMLSNDSFTRINDNSASEIKFKTDYLNKTVEQQFRVNISKIDDLTSDAQLSIPFTAQANMLFNFAKKSDATFSFKQSNVVESLPKEMTIEPCTQLKYMISFHTYTLTINYWMSFEINANSVIKHPHVPDGTSNVVFTKTPLIDFLKKIVTFVNGIKYENSTAIKLQSIDNARFKLENFPTTEEITNVDADVSVISTEKVSGCGETTTMRPTTTTTTTTISTTTTEEPTTIMT